MGRCAKRFETQGARSRITPIFFSSRAVLSKVLKDDPDGAAVQLIRSKLKQWSQAEEVSAAKIEKLPKAEQFGRTIVYMATS